MNHSIQDSDPALQWPRRHDLYFGAVALVLTLVLFPLWSVNLPGLIDYPNHLTRCYIIAHLHWIPVFAQRYVLHTEPIPDLAIDAFVVPLNKFLPIALCGKLFLSLTAILFVAGCLLLGHAIHGKRSWIALPLSLTFYNAICLAGYVNYIFGVSLFLCIFAYWLRHRAEITWPRFFWLCLLSIVAFFVHLSCVAILGFACLTVVLLELPRSLTGNIFRELGWLACPPLLMLAYMKHGDKAGTIAWSTPRAKLIHLVTPIHTYNSVLDGVAAILGAVCIFWFIRRGRMNRIAIVGAVLFFLFLIGPNDMLASSDVDVRFVLPAFLVVMLAIAPEWHRRESLLFSLLFITLASRIFSVESYWKTASQQETRLLQMGDQLPENAKVYVVKGRISSHQDLAYINVLNLWTITHHASVSTLFTTAGQPITNRDPGCQTASLGSCIGSYDFVWTNDASPQDFAILQAKAQPFSQWNRMTLWRVTKPQT